MALISAVSAGPGDRGFNKHLHGLDYVIMRPDDPAERLEHFEQFAIGGARAEASRRIWLFFGEDSFA